MTTKEQERKALAKIRKIVEELGEDSYIGTAFDGAFEIAEQNIAYDSAFSVRGQLEQAQSANDAERERIARDRDEWRRKAIDRSQEIIERENIIEKLTSENARLARENANLLEQLDTTCADLKLSERDVKTLGDMVDGLKSDVRMLADALSDEQDFSEYMEYLLTFDNADFLRDVIASELDAWDAQRSDAASRIVKHSDDPTSEDFKTAVDDHKKAQYEIDKRNAVLFRIEKKIA